MPAPPKASDPPRDAASAPARHSEQRRRRLRQRPGELEPGGGALQVTEEAFHLLRTTPLANLWLYYLGTVPFVLAAFFFWADMSRSSYAARDAALGALGLAAVYLWMKFWQGLFCRRLWEQLHPSGDTAELSRMRYFRHFAAQAFLHAFALPVRLLSLVFIGWTLAFFQNVSVLAFSQNYGRQPLRHTLRTAARFAHQSWGQNYLILLLMAVLSLFIWINLIGAAALIPQALKMFFGMETAFTLNPGSTLLNSTFLFATVLLAFLVIDPLLKAIYTLRCFALIARHTGADLLARLDRVESGDGHGNTARPVSSPSMMALLLLAITSLLPGSLAARETDGAPSGEASENATMTSPATPTGDDLAASIEETLRGKDYQWRLPKRDMAGHADREKGWLATLMSDLADSVERTVKRIFNGVEEFFRKLFEGKRSNRDRPAPSLGAAGAGIGAAAKILFVVVIAALFVWVVWLLVRRAGQKTNDLADDAGAAGPVDLESDTIVATQLPEDEWMRLAREQIAKGEHRLAVRALFLASLAHLGDRGLLRVARFKSNRDYSRELELKARALPGLRSAFGENVGLFERVWYGLHEIGREAIDRFSANYERITRGAAPDPIESPGQPSHLSRSKGGEPPRRTDPR